MCAITAWSAILIKESHAGNGAPVPALAALTEVNARTPAMERVVAEPVVDASEEVAVEERVAEATGVELWPVGTRFFNGRPIRPVKTMKMVVTAYSPDARSCGEFADGMTATLHSVDTNAHRLVAADPRVLAYGSMLTIPGYDNGQVVPVLDCGGAIKGNRLDLLFPTHEQARKWGRKTITVTVWGYADGKPAPNPRKAREGRAG